VLDDPEEENRLSLVLDDALPEKPVNAVLDDTPSS
jgi:hypothetical protein